MPPTPPRETPPPARPTFECPDAQSSREAERDWQRLVLFVVGLGFLLVIAGAVNARPLASAALAEKRFDTAGAGSLRLTDADGRSLLAPWLDTEVDVTVSGVIARVRVRQRFVNVADGWVAGEYGFPLPGDAAVREMRLRVAGREIVGRVQARDEARATYERAKADGQRAALVERNRADVFAVSVANIPPGEFVDVVIDYVQPLAFEDGRFEFRFPMTITPRFATATAADAPALPDAVLDPAEDYRALAGIRLALGDDVDVQSLNSPSHRITTARGEDGDIALALAEGKVVMNRDFVLRWLPAAGQLPRLAAWAEVIEGETYALALVVPPAEAPSQRRRRELVVVIDVSGSMQGQSIVQAKQAAAFALDTLTPADRVNVIAFSDAPRALFPFAVPADHHAVRRAQDFVRGLEAGGGTQMAPALEAAFAARPPDEHLRQVVFVTDGAVDDVEGLAARVSGGRGEARLFPVGIGAAPATHLMQRLAEAGRGTYTQVADTGEVDARMRGLFARLEQPVLTDVEVRWPGQADALAEPAPAQVPDLYAGEPLVLAAKLSGVGHRGDGGPRGQLEVRGRLGGRPWSQAVPLGAARPAAGVGVVWAQRRLAILAAAAPDGPGDDGASRRAAITQIGLRHSLVTRYTSFVAVERQPLRPLSASLDDTRVPALLPAGGPRIGYPATATPAPALAAIAVFTLLFGALLRVLGRVRG